MNEIKCLAYCHEFTGTPMDRTTSRNVLEGVIPLAQSWALTPDDFAAVAETKARAESALAK